MPWYLLYDYVEVFKYDHDANEFHLHWRDDFETFDSLRWHKATGGFDANSSEFHPENVSVKAGNLVLKMEPASDEEKEEAPHHTHSVDAHEEDIAHNLHRSEHFDREHARSHKDSEKGRVFWIDHQIDHDLAHENERDGINLDADRHHEDDYRHEA